MKTFTGRRIDYSYEIVDEMNKAILSEASTNLMTTRKGEPYYDYLMNWFRNAEAETKLSLKWKLGTPAAHIRDAMHTWYRFLYEARAFSRHLYPLGVESPRRIGNLKQTPRIIFGTFSHFQYGIELLYQMKRNYKTLSGHLYGSLLSDLIIGQEDFWLWASMHPEQIEAHDYSKVCRELQATAAGRKAKRLLLDNLTDTQTKDYWTKGYFFVRPKEADDIPLENRKLYVIERGYPNGNIASIFMGPSKGGRTLLYREFTFCFHAVEPHPIDDILLAQKLIIEEDHDTFLKLANRYQSDRNMRAPLDITSRAI